MSNKMSYFCFMINYTKHSTDRTNRSPVFTIILHLVYIHVSVLITQVETKECIEDYTLKK